jgi:hypothetical protein
MRIRYSLLAAVLLLAIVTPLAAAAPPPAQLPAAAPADRLASPPRLDAFLASLDQPAPLPASSCGPSFCTQAQRNACNQQCIRQGHKFFVGLECCSNCTTLCICGSVPVNC